MKNPQRRKGQTMVEYIIIVVLIAITCLSLFMYFGKAIGKKVSGATSALDEDIGSEAESEYNTIDIDKIKNLDETGEF